MIITERDLLVLLALAHYYVLSRAKAQQLCFPHDTDGCVARRRLAALAGAGLIRRHTMLVASSRDTVPAPVYLLDTKGCVYLAKVTGDPQYLHKPVDLPHPLHLRHHLAVADLHLLLDAAIAAQTVVVLEAWHNEADIVNAGEAEAHLPLPVGHAVRRQPRHHLLARRWLCAESGGPASCILP